MTDSSRLWFTGGKFQFKCRRLFETLFQMHTLTIGLKTDDFYRVLLLSTSDNFYLCQLKGDFPDPVVPDYSRIF